MCGENDFFEPAVKPLGGGGDGIAVHRAFGGKSQRGGNHPALFVFHGVIHPGGFAQGQVFHLRAVGLYLHGHGLAQGGVGRAGFEQPLARRQRKGPGPRGVGAGQRVGLGRPLGKSINLGMGCFGPVTGHAPQHRAALREKGREHAGHVARAHAEAGFQCHALARLQGEHLTRRALDGPAVDGDFQRVVVILQAITDVGPREPQKRIGLLFHHLAVITAAGGEKLQAVAQKINHAGVKTFFETRRGWKQ